MNIYKDMIREVLRTGTRKENRTGVDTISTFNHNYEISWYEKDGSWPEESKLQAVAHGDGAYPIPLLTTKQISWKNIVVEMLWFLSGSTNIEILKRHGCKFWDAWADEDGEVPSAYGNFWRNYPCFRGPYDPHVPQPSDYEPYGNDQIGWVVGELRRNPMSRRLVVSAWAPDNAQTSKLPPCHFAMAFNVQNVRMRSPILSSPGVYEQRLCLHLTQRSCDLALGVPYNIASYGLLLLIMCHLTGLKPGIFAHTLVDLHIYTRKPDGSMAEYDHVPGLQKQLTRPVGLLPVLTIDPAIKELSDIEALMAPHVTTDQILAAFKLDGYEPAPAIKFKVAV